jgi:hypothetical protein
MSYYQGLYPEQQQPLGSDFSASLDFGLAHLTRQKMEHEAHKQQHDLRRLVALCNTLDLYTDRLRHFHSPVRSGIHVPALLDDCDIYEEIRSSNRHSNCASDDSDRDSDSDSDNEGNFEDTVPSESYLDSNCDTSIENREHLTPFWNQELNHPQRGDTMPGQPNSVADESPHERICDVEKHNDHIELCKENSQYPFGHICQRLTNWLHAKSVPRELYKMADLTF